MSRQSAPTRLIVIALLLAAAALIAWIVFSDSGVPDDAYKL
ncbi:MAG: hypothetical protein RL277_2631 [Planctomycetota bacterium]|jgi:hypothetical protein